jgi:chromosome segregation ATPase
MRLPAQLACCLILLTVGHAQRRQDPLNPLEVDKLRDAAQDPDTRLKLYVEFARDRLTALEQMRVDPKVTDRAQQTHDRLQDFVDVYDELDDNIDNFVKREDDLRKPLKRILEADSEFQAKLRALHDAADVHPEEAKQYEFLLSTALDTLDSAAKDHHNLLAEQEEAAKHKKKAAPSPPVREFR